MAFFDVPKDEDVSPEVRAMLAEYLRVSDRGEVPEGWKAFLTAPGIVEARVVTYRNLFRQCIMPWDVTILAFMLIAHAKRCQVCFVGSRQALNRLGWDEATLNDVCAHPEALPLKERDRAFVRYALKIAMDPIDVKLEDLKDMEARGLTKDEIRAAFGLAAFANFYMTFTLSQHAWLVAE